MKKIKSALNLAFVVFVIYVLSCSHPVKDNYKEKIVHPPLMNPEKQQVDDGKLILVNMRPIKDREEKIGINGFNKHKEQKI